MFWKSCRFSTIAVVASLLVLAGCNLTEKLNISRVSEKPAAPLDDSLVAFNEVFSFERLNAVRAKHFLRSFRPDPRLMAAAQRHANLMGETGRFGHEFGPDTKFKRRIFAVGFKNSAGENIGVGYRSIDAAIEGWLNSPGHRKILLKRNYSLGGIAYARNTSGKNPRLNHFWVLIVGQE